MASVPLPGPPLPSHRLPPFRHHWNLGIWSLGVPYTNSKTPSNKVPVLGEEREWPHSLSWPPSPFPQTPSLQTSLESWNLEFRSPLYKLQDSKFQGSSVRRREGVASVPLLAPPLPSHLLHQKVKKGKIGYQIGFLNLNLHLHFSEAVYVLFNNLKLTLKNYLPVSFFK